MIFIFYLHLLPDHYPTATALGAREGWTPFGQSFLRWGQRRSFVGKSAGRIEFKLGNRARRWARSYRSQISYWISARSLCGPHALVSAL